MKKQLLNESEIRKLMKFANIGSLTSGFVNKLDESVYVNEQDEEGMEEPPMEEPPVEEPPVEEPAAEEPADDSVLEGVKTCIQALKAGLESMGLQEAADAITMEMTDEEDPSMEEPGLEDAGGEMPDLDMSPEEEDPEALMQEVLTRVVKRLRRASNS
jgi:hypothetical protein